jgi:hypothetical protein
MKKTIILLPVCLILFLCSCNNEELTFHYELKASVSSASLVTGLVNPYDNNSFFPNNCLNTDFQFVTDFLIYDAEGSQVSHKSWQSETFGISDPVSDYLERGTYTLITLEHIVYGSTSFTDYAWKPENLSTLESAGITLAEYNDQYGLLGYDKQTVQIDDSSQAITITPTHLGALYVIVFDNIDYSKIRYIKYSQEMDPDTYRFSTDEYSRDSLFSFGATLDTEGKYTAYYTYAYLLPNSGLQLTYSLYSTDSTCVGSGTVNMIVQKGVHRVVDIDVNEATYSSRSLKVSTDVPVKPKTAAGTAKHLSFKLETNRLEPLVKSYEQ